MTRRSATRKRGALVQNLLYAVFAVMVTMAIFQSYVVLSENTRRSESVQRMARLTDEVRFLYRNTKVFSGLTATHLIQNGVGVSEDYEVRRTAFRMPHKGRLIFYTAGGRNQFFMANVTFPDASSTALCKFLSSGHTSRSPRIDQGPMGRDYTVWSATCSENANQIIAMYYP